LNGSGDLVFTKNCTEAINIVSHGIDWKEGDKVITTCLEHNSNLLPWLALKSKGVEVVILKCSRDGTIDLGELAEAVDEKTRIVAVIHASNVLGTIVPVADIAEIVRKKGAMLLIDGAQSTPHLRVDVDKLGCDFYAGSGHKMCGPSGTGFLYINKGGLDQVRPMMLGGGSATDVQPDQITFTKGPGIFEAGTPNIAGGIGLGAAADYLESLGMDEIRKHEIQLS
jgi:cysteine desulfurase/selenocysteine lyase